MYIDIERSVLGSSASGVGTSASEVRPPASGVRPPASGVRSASSAADWQTVGYHTRSWRTVSVDAPPAE